MTEDRKRAATLVDVAERAGVAIGTLWRFLKGELVRAANRDQIARAIAELGYQRNTAAVAMKTDETRILGFMAPGLSDFHATLLDPLTRKMRVSGRAVLSYCHDQQPASMRERLEIVLCDNDLPGVPADRVFVDNHGVSARLVGHMIDLGHRRIAVLHGALRDATVRERLQGWRDALVAAGLPVDETLCLDGDWTETGGAEAMAAFLAQPIDRMADAIHDLALARLENPGRLGKREVRLDCEILLRGSVRSPLQKAPPDGAG